MKLLLLSNDLMIGSCVEGAARQHGLTMQTVRDQQAAVDFASEADSRVLIVDLRVPGLDVDALVKAVRDGRELHLPIVACAPHVHEAKLAAAREAGCDAVITRGQLDREVGEIVGRLLTE